MGLSFELTGFEELFKKLDGFIERLSDRSMIALGKESSHYLLRVFDKNFATEGKTLNQPWKELSMATMQDRERKGFPPAHPILFRTGKLKRGFKSKIDRTGFTIINVTPYFPFHQIEGKIPKRLMMALDKQRREALIRNFKEFILTPFTGGQRFLGIKST